MRFRYVLKSGTKPVKVNKRDDVMMVVYVLTAGEFVKIGITDNIKTRVVCYRTHCPLTIAVEFCSKRLQRPIARGVEVRCHERFAEHAVHGEWFKVDVSRVLNFITGLVNESDDTIEHPQLRLVA